MGTFRSLHARAAGVLYYLHWGAQLVQDAQRWSQSPLGAAVG